MARTGGKTSFTREDVIELLAALDAAGEFVDVEDVVLTPEQRANALHRLNAGLVHEFLGDLVEPDPDDTSDSYWENDEDELEIRARSAEIEADLIDDAYKAKADDVRMHARWQAEDGRSARNRLFAERLREAGTQAGIYYPSADEMQAVARERSEGATS